MSVAGDLDGLRVLPVPRRVTHGLRLADLILLVLAWSGAAYCVYWMALDEWGFIFGAMLYLGVLAAIPPWAHLRLWPIAGWLAGDAIRREEFVLAGLGTGPVLWRTVRAPVGRMLFIPVTTMAALLAGLMYSMATANRGAGDDGFWRIAVGGVGVALAVTALSLAGVGDVLRRLCVRPARSVAAIAALVWIGLALGAAYSMVFVPAGVSADLVPPGIAMGLLGSVVLMVERWMAAVRAFGRGVEAG